MGGSGGGAAACCYVTALSPTEAVLYQRSSVAEVQPNVDIEELLKENQEEMMSAAFFFATVDNPPFVDMMSIG